MTYVIEHLRVKLFYVKKINNNIKE